MLGELGHDAWTIPEAGMGTFKDDDVSVYAHEKNAILITDDRELLSRRRHEQFYGQVIGMRGTKALYVTYLGGCIDTVLALFQAHADLVVDVGPLGFMVTAPWRDSRWTAG